MNIDEIIETSYEVEETISHLIGSIYTSWERLQEKESKPSQEQIIEWREFATQVIHSAVKQVLTREKA